MAKKQFQLTIKSVAAVARNKRLRLAGVGGGGSTTIVNGGGSGSSGSVSTLVTLVTSGEGNAFTRATQSSDKLTITLYKDSTFLDEDTLVDVITELVGVLDDRFLHKDRDDSTPYSLTIGGNLTVDKEGTFGGNVSIAKDGTIVGSLDVGKDVTIGGETTSKGVINAKDGVKFGEYTQGLLGSGGYIDAQGNGELGGLTLRNFLEVPELRFNRVSVIAGTQWQTAGQGLIEEVEVTGTYTGHCKLHLDEGEYGAIEEGDLCFGVFHNFEDTSQNYTGDDDDSQTGDFLFKGFCSVYFRITSVNDTKSEFDYELRNDGSWQFFHHPQPQMTFAGYGNAYSDRVERQKCIYSTLTYTLFCESVTTWNFGKENIYMILGKLDGFTVQGTEISGDGAYLRNAFISGSIVQISNMPFVMTFSDTLAWVVNTGETDTITCKISKLTQDVTSEFSSWTAKIEGGGELTINNRGVITASYDELFASSDSVMVDVTATHTDSGEVVNDSFAIRKFDESKDGLSIIQSFDSITFNADNNTFDFSLEVLRGNVHDTITSYSISDTPTGVSRTNTTNNNGVLSFTLTRNDTSVNISGKLTITFTVDSVTYTRYLYLLTAVDGEDAYYIYTSRDNIIITNLDGYTIDIGLYIGGQQVALHEDNVAISSVPSGVDDAYVGTYGNIVNWRFDFPDYASRKSLNSTFTITVTYNGVSLQKAIPVLAVYDGDDGDDAIQLGSTSEVLVWKTSSDVDRYFFLQLRQGNELIEFSSSDITIKSKPTGVNIDLVGYFTESGFEIEATFTGVLSNTELDGLLEFEVTSNKVTYTKQIRCVAVYDGQDAAGIAIDIPMQEMVIKGTCSEDFCCHIYVNNELYPIDKSAISVDNSQVSGPFGFQLDIVDNGNIYFNYFCLVYGGAYPLDAIIPVTFTINGIEYVRNFHMYTVFDGSASEKGADAVVYELDCSVSTIHYQAAAGAFAPSQVTCNLYKVTGNYKEAYNGEIEVECQYVGNTAWRSIHMGDTSLTFTPAYSSLWGYPSQYRITATTPQGDIEKIITVTNSCAIRVQNWEDIEEEGFDFESGQIGETFYDFVVYNNGGTLFYYQCIKSHTKFKGEEVTDTEYWKSVNSFDAVATNLLLAGTAKIDNLYVDDVYMEDKGKTTAIWVNPLFKGMKILNYGALGNVVGRENQVEDGQERDCWANPTAWFHGATVPSVDEIYNDSTSEDESADLYENNTGSTNKYGYWALAEESSIKSLWSIRASANTALKFVFDNIVTLTEGTGGEQSYVSCAMQISYENSELGEVLLWEGYFGTNGGNGSGSTTQGKMENKSVTLYFDKSTIVYVTVWCRQYCLAPSANFAISSTWSYRTVKYGYVSQYGADGVFIGISSEDYFRLTANITDGIKHELLSNGNGVEVNSIAPLQISNSVKMPLGGVLMSGYFWVENNALYGKMNTFDGNMPTLLRSNTGRYRITFPYSKWLANLGTSSFYASDYCATISLANVEEAGHTVVCYQGTNAMDIRSYDANGKETDGNAFSLIITFIGCNAPVISSINTTSLSTDADAKLLDDAQQADSSTN